MLCGSSANENAFKAAMMAYENQRRGVAPGGAYAHTQQEKDASMVNEARRRPPAPPPLTTPTLSAWSRRSRRTFSDHQHGQLLSPSSLVAVPCAVPRLARL